MGFFNNKLREGPGVSREAMGAPARSYADRGYAQRVGEDAGRRECGGGDDEGSSQGAGEVSGRA